MGEIYTGAQDETTIQLVLEKGLNVPRQPKWIVLRLALSQSLRIATPPDDFLDRIEDRKGGGEYHLEQVTGQGKPQGEDGVRIDYDDAIRALLSVYHEQDLFNDEIAYRRLLQRHIRRGLREFRNGWRESHDFHEYLYQELFADQVVENQAQPDLDTDLERGLSEIGVEGELRDSLPGPRITRFLIFLPNVNDLDKLNRGVGKLNFFLGLQNQGVFISNTSESKLVAVDVPRSRETWKTIPGSQLAEWIDRHEGNERLPIWPGVDVLGNPLALDLAEAPHLLVGGTTGSGKSVCLHSILVSILRNPSKSPVRFCLIDPKQTEFEPYRRLPSEALFSGKVVNDPADALEILSELLREMESRTRKLVELGVRDIREAHEKGATDLPFLLVFVDELADLLMQSRQAEEPLIRLAQKARTTGIHLVLATQRPDAATFSGQLRSNIPSRIALTVQKSSESKIILDETGAEKLTGGGDMLVKTAHVELTRVHGVRVMADDIAAAISRFGRGFS